MRVNSLPVAMGVGVAGLVAGSMLAAPIIDSDPNDQDGLAAMTGVLFGMVGTAVALGADSLTKSGRAGLGVAAALTGNFLLMTAGGLLFTDLVREAKEAIR